jgi:hypothetical protein
LRDDDYRDRGRDDRARDDRARDRDRRAQRSSASSSSLASYSGSSSFRASPTSQYDERGERVDRYPARPTEWWTSLDEFDQNWI